MLQKSHPLQKDHASLTLIFNLSKPFYVFYETDNMPPNCGNICFEIYEAKTANSDDVISTYFAKTGHVTYI